MAKVRLIWTLIFFFSAASLVQAQARLSVYGGGGTTMPGTVSGNEPGGLGAFSFPMDWTGPTTDVAPDFGIRLTWWEENGFGWGLDFNRSRIYASDSSLRDAGITRLDFGEGLNLLTVNAYRRWQPEEFTVTPYVGAGLGVVVPNVAFNSGSGLSIDSQMGGPSMQWVAGASVPIGGNLSVFGEYKGTFTVNSADLNGGGHLETNLQTNAINVGISLGF